MIVRTPYDRDGNPIDHVHWWELRDQVDYQHIAADDLGQCRIATVWLGIDPDRSDLLPPRIFETRIHGGPYGGSAQRYHTETQAREGHCRAVVNLQAGVAPWWMASKMVV
jgi:hypothetical protein